MGEREEEKKGIKIKDYCDAIILFSLHRPPTTFVAVSGARDDYHRLITCISAAP